METREEEDSKTKTKQKFKHQSVKTKEKRIRRKLIIRCECNKRYVKKHLYLYIRCRQSLDTHSRKKNQAIF